MNSKNKAKTGAERQRDYVERHGSEAKKRMKEWYEKNKEDLARKRKEDRNTRKEIVEGAEIFFGKVGADLAEFLKEKNSRGETYFFLRVSS